MRVAAISSSLSVVLKPAFQGPFSDDDPMLIGEPFYELLVGMGSEMLFNFFLEGLQIDRWVIGVSEVGAG